MLEFTIGLETLTREDITINAPQIATAHQGLFPEFDCLMIIIP